MKSPEYAELAEHRGRQWLLGGLLLTLAWLPPVGFGAGLLVLFVLWRDSPALTLLILFVAIVTRGVLGAPGPLPGRVVRPADEPELAALVQDVADRLGFRRPLLVRIVPDVRASLGRARVSGVRTRVLLLGLPLLRTLTEAQLASVIAHELAHERHVSSPRATLLRYSRARSAERLEGRFRPLAPLAGALLRASQPVLWRAETAADADAARIAGTAATAGALRRTALVGSVFERLGETWLSQLAEEESYPEDFYDALDAALSDPHVARRAARAAAEDDALDPYATADHPPLRQRLAALPTHPEAPYGPAPLGLRTAATVETWCLRQITGHEDGGTATDGTPVRLLGTDADRRRQLEDGTGPLLLCLTTRRKAPEEAVAVALDAIADGTWPRLARRLEPSLRRAPAAARDRLARSALMAAVSRTLVGPLRAAGWTPAGPWLDTVLTAPDGGDAVDVHQLVGEALDSGDPGPLRALPMSAGPREKTG
ncbi:M48 family metalloprotease [Streptomyces sp. NBC_01334]|uniref:M48 family metalloprotease n=1 Tax=Streptomyces sp. NBC_01334 TaxID=2903827 RepID=UPI002E115D99|nr:M48 family metalloprotease [Streptomyces sp. NBC_01334]